jgi:hypothetical protein
MKFTKKNGDYVAGDYLVRKSNNIWNATYKGQGIGWSRTLTGAKAFCEHFEASRLTNLENLQRSAAKELAEAEHLQRCASCAEWSPSFGIPWHIWAEAKIGSTLKELRDAESAVANKRRIKRIRERLDYVDFDDCQAELEEMLDMLMGQLNDSDKWLTKLTHAKQSA